MSKENSERIDNEELRILHKFNYFSQLLDPSIETISLSESKYMDKIYFKESKKLCFSYEYESNMKKKLYIFQNIKIEVENDRLISKYYLLELFFTIPLRFDIRTIKIKNFPINKKDLGYYLNGLNKSYQKRFTPQKESFSSDNKSLLSGVYQIKITVKNHYIPQGYLRRFKCEDKAGFVYNFKLNEGKLDESSGVVPVKIENILYILRFYSLGMELLLKNIEDTFYDIRNKIISDISIKNIVYEEKISIVRYIFAQYIRTPLERNRLINLARYMLETLYFDRINQDTNNDKINYKFNELYIRKIIEEDMYRFLYPSQKETGQLELIDFYLKNKWKLISAENMKFYTSDNPIILHNNSYNPIIDQDYVDSLKTPNSKIFGTKRPHGLMEPGIQLYFPITPKLCLLIYNLHLGQRLLNPVEINEQVLIQCYQNIISSNNKIKNFLKRKLKQKRKKRQIFVELHLNVKIEEF